MSYPWNIQRIAVLGAGVMGAQIAAHCVNAGYQTLLFDLPDKEGHGSALARKAIANLPRLKPEPLADAALAACIRPCNYADDSGLLGDCDLVIEAIGERFDWKEGLYRQILPVLGERTILVTNTSGLGINALAAILPEDMRPRFCGVHFFNPPRYMHLAELIPGSATTPTLCDYLETWLTSALGKGVVRAKDTPNFVANRIGVFSMLSVLHHARAFSLAPDTVDALTGSLLGRPKSATFRTMDVVGLDTMQHVVHTLHEQLPDDPWFGYFALPDWLQRLVSEGALGQKSGHGVYRKTAKGIEVFDPDTGKYRDSNPVVDPEIREIFAMRDPVARFEALQASGNQQAQFLVACYRDLFHYSAFHLADIATSVRDIDLALRWGFGWQQGPFETWQHAGIGQVSAWITSAIESRQAPAGSFMPVWLKGLSAFYQDNGAWSPVVASWIPRSALPVYQKQLCPPRMPGETGRAYETLYENPGVRLWRLDEDIAVISFRSKANTVGDAVLEGMDAALDVAQDSCRGVILWQEDPATFSAGADLRQFAEQAQKGEYDRIAAMIARFQQLVMRVKYSPMPVVAALRGRALGGGCELMMHCSATVAAFESYPGLVEIGVGLIPAGGGCKEIAWRAACGEGDVFERLKPRFEQIATGWVAGSAPQAAARGYLQARDVWIMHADEVLYAAQSQIQAMLAADYRPPMPVLFRVAGREGHARFQAWLVNLREGGFVSEHDYFLANRLAWVLCGGDVDAGTEVDEAWILRLELAVFMELLKTPKTQARIQAMLETGKPLRN